MAKCKAKALGLVKYRGKPSIEWHKNGKPQYYCYGYIDMGTESLLPVCRACKDHVYQAQEDVENYNKSKQKALEVE